MNTVRITAPTVSQAVKEFLEENSIGLESISANLISEKVFTDKKEYTVEMLKKTLRENPLPPAGALDEDVQYAKEILTKLLSLMKFMAFEITEKKDGTLTVLKVSTDGKDGLLIGKNGQNIMALQYLLSIMLDKNLRKHVPVVIDVDTYREKRAVYLKSLVKNMAYNISDSSPEAITEFLPSYERKMIHEELKITGLKTFSVGRGSYKKVVITSLL